MRYRLILIYMVTMAVLFFNSTEAYSDQKAQEWSDFKGSFAEESIIRLAGHGIVSGSPGEFSPEDRICRIQFAVLIARVLGIQPVFPSSWSFADIPRGTLEAGYIEAMAGLHIVSGSGGERFEPEDPVLRQDAAVLLHRALGGGPGRLSLTESYIDSGYISPYAAESVAYVTGNGLMSGSDRFFYPLRELTVAEASVLAAQLLDLRRSQSITAVKIVSPQQDWLRVGETRQINVSRNEIFPPFTSVYGMDNSDVFNVCPECNSASGKQPGKGTITVNAGYNHYTVKADVFTARSGVKASAGWADRNNTDGMPGAAAETLMDVEYSIKQQAPDADFQTKEYKNHPGPVDGLTSNSQTWTGFLRQHGRDIIVDLKTARPVAKVSLEFWHNPEWGVFLPDYMKAEVSVDGKSWYHLGYVYHGVSPSETTARDVNMVLSFPPVTARYIKVYFPVDGWVFARHLFIWGRGAGIEPVVLAYSQTPGKDVLPGGYLQVPGIKDILLVYTGDRSDSQTLTAGDFLPVVAYHDRRGVMAGRMFDTMLFLPDRQLNCTSDAWGSYLEDLFAPGKNLWALEEAVAKVNGVPGMQGKEKVILTIPYPDVSQQQFGALEKEKDPLSFSEKSAGREEALIDRFSAVQWYYNKMMGMWNSAGFKHLDLAGVYWYGEAIDKTVSGEKELVQNVARMVRGSGRNFFWIPYFGQNGYEDWKSYGFTHVFLQPNYYAKENPQEDRMDMAAEMARRHGMGIELECDEGMLYSRYYYDLFYRQLKKGHQLGLDGDTTNAYYAGFIKKTLVSAARSNVPQIRAIYDDIYRWISGTYN